MEAFHCGAERTTTTECRRPPSAKPPWQLRRGGGDEDTMRREHMGSACTVEAIGEASVKDNPAVCSGGEAATGEKLRTAAPCHDTVRTGRAAGAGARAAGVPARARSVGGGAGGTIMRPRPRGSLAAGALAAGAAQLSGDVPPPCGTTADCSPVRGKSRAAISSAVNFSEARRALGSGGRTRATTGTTVLVVGVKMS